MASGRYQLDEEYDDKLASIQQFCSASNKTQALRDAIDFFLMKNKGKINQIPETIEDKFNALFEEISVLKDEVEELKLKV